MSGEWQPNPQYLNYLVQLLKAATTVKDTCQQAQISKAMEDFNTLPESDNYLLVVLTEPKLSSTDDTVRGMAGLILKNSFRRREELPLSTLAFVKSFNKDHVGQCALVRLLGDPQPLVRNTVGTLLATIVARLGRELGSFWPELLPLLLSITTEASLMGEAAANSIAKIFEDAGEELAQDVTKPLDNVVPQLISLCNESTNEKIRIQALASLNNLIIVDQALDGYIGSFIQLLSYLADREKSNLMRKAICQSLNSLQDFYSQEMRPILPAVLEYMFENLQLHEDDAVSLEACEFWLSFVERDSTSEVVSPILPRLLRVLIDNIVYAEDDPDLEANEEIAVVPDRSQDIKPRHHKLVTHEEGELSESEEGKDDGENSSNWTLRKCSAATVDVLAMTMPEHEFVPIILPLISEKLTSSDWKCHEAGILAFGAISEGCMEAILPHLSSVVPFLVQSANTQVPLVRAIAVWTLSRYANWIETSEFDSVTLQSILNAMTSGNKKVQHAACTSLGVFAERAKSTVSGHLPLVMQAIHFGLLNYQTKSLIVLYDVVGTIADEVGDELVASNTLSSILPALISHWSQTKDLDQTIFALLECMCSLSISCGVQMESFVPIIYQRSITMIETTLRAAAISNDETDYEFAIVALDLIGGLVQGLGERMTPIVSEHSPSLLIIITHCLQNEVADVRQSAFALIGDMAQKCATPLIPLIDDGSITEAIDANLDVVNEDNSQGAANNAVWALGELYLKYPSRLSSSAPLLNATLSRLIKYEDHSVSRGYLENIAVALGRGLGLCAPPDAFPLVLGRWAHLISMVGDLVERETAWIPVLNLLASNPQFIQKDALHGLLKGVHQFRRPQHQLEVAFSTLVMIIINQIIGLDNWTKFRTTELADIPIDFEQRFGIITL